MEVTYSKLETVDQCEHWNNHLPLVLMALRETPSTGTVIEMGMGEGSTLWLHEYCTNQDRPLLSYDNNPEYFNKFKHLHSSRHHLELITNWETTPTENVNVVLIDHAPGERRYLDAIRYKDINGILILHDTEEPPCGGNYDWNKAFIHFKYFARIKGESLDGVHNGVWATAVSNTHDMSHWVGKTFGKYTIEA